MRIFTLNFNKNAGRSNNGWRLSHKENGSNFSSLVCNIAGVRAYVSTTKALQAVLDQETNTSVLGKIRTVALYEKSLLDVKEEGKANRESYAIYVEAEAGQKLAAIKLDGCATAFQKIAKDNSAAAFIVVATAKDFRVRIYQTNKKVITVNAEGKIINEVVKHDVKEPVNTIRLKKLVPVPKKIVVTRFVDHNAVDTKEGFVPVSIAQLLSKYSVIVGAPKEIAFGGAIKEEEYGLVNALFAEKIRPAATEAKQCENCDTCTCGLSHEK